MIVVFGSINTDIAFPVQALPVPGETVLGAHYVLSPGGKGANQALAAARSGARVALFGCVGEDAFAATALSMLKSGRVDLGGVRRVARPTALAAIAIDSQGENQIIVASGANSCAFASDVSDMVLDGCTTLVMQLEVALDQIVRLAARARARGAKVVLNAAPAATLPEDLLRDVDILVVNEIEAEMLASGVGAGSAEHLARAIETPVVVTLGVRGAVAFGVGPEIRTGIVVVEPHDTAGAGDAFVGALAAVLDRGGDLENAMRYGSVAGALACRQLGAQAALPSLSEIELWLPQLGPAL